MKRTLKTPSPDALLLVLAASLGATTACGPSAPIGPEGLESVETITELPQFEQTPEAVAATVERVLAAADSALDALAAQDLEEATYASTIGALDDIVYPVMTVLNRYWLMKETQPDAVMRNACTAQVQVMDEWAVALQYREDVYLACRAYADALGVGERPPLAGEQRKLLEDTMRDYRRAGFELDAATRKQVEVLQNEHNRLTTTFDTNVTNANETLYFTTEELDGVPENFLKSSRQDDGRHAVRVTVTPDYMVTIQNAKSGAVRKRLNRARYSVAMAENGPVLAEIVRARAKIASLLGYDNWADYKIEPKMAKTGAIAVEFLEGLSAGLQAKFDAEVERLRELKVAETGDPKAQIMFWDFRYYTNQLLKQEYSVDTEALRVYFELDTVLTGMFEVYETIFSLRFHEVEPPYAWVSDLRLFRVEDEESGQTMGHFYLDLFPREGKYNHFAMFDVIGGKLLPDGRYRRPVVALVCNFPAPSEERPSLLSHNEVETVFHEFGHAMHAVLTWATVGQFAGSNTPRDFVEAPSQMFENWAWDLDVLSRFAYHHEDASKLIPAETIEAMREANMATKGMWYRRQLALGLSDLRMHVGDGAEDPGAIADRTHAEILFPVQEGTNFCAYWGHLTGYDAGYYGYAWADSIAADLATAFEGAPGRFLDKEVGMRLRREIYQVGSSRPVEASIRKFLEREPSNAAFLKTIGLSE